MKTVALMLKEIHAQESKEAAREKSIQIAEKLKSMKLGKATKKWKMASKKHEPIWIFQTSIGLGFG